MGRSKNNVQPIELETERFRLIPIRPLSLALQTWHWTQDRESFANLGWRSSGWTRRRWFRHLQHQVRGGRFCHGIWLKPDGPYIGLHLLSLAMATRSAIMGVIICERDWWGRGVVPEIRTSIIDDCFDRLQLERLGGQVQARNLGSVYNYRRLGFVHEGSLRSAGIDRDGKYVDMLLFGILRSEWTARQRKAPE
jgi:RimJ/RimL family protein N-acetyltransferase